MTEYLMTADYHTHTKYSHGTGSIEDNVRAAYEKGISGLGISDHGPGHINYGIKISDIPQMRAEIEALKKSYGGMEIYLSVEANIVEKGNGLDIDRDCFPMFDYVIAGYHFGTLHSRMIRNFLASNLTTAGTSALKNANTDMIIKALYNNKIKILSHPGDKAPVDISEVAKACADTGTLMEINTHHGHMTCDEIRTAAEHDVEFVISSDAHIPSAVGSFESGLAELEKAGVDMKRVINISSKEVH